MQRFLANSIEFNRLNYTIFLYSLNSELANDKFGLIGDAKMIRGFYIEFLAVVGGVWL